MNEIHNILAAHHAVLASGGARLVQARHWRPVTRVEVGGTEYAVKQYARGSAGARVRRLLRGTRARAAGRRCALLEARGIAAAPSVGIVESPPWLEPESYLITRWIEGPCPSQRMRALRDQRDEAGRAAFLEQGGRWLAGLHRSGVWMNDCWDGNFVAAESGSFWIVDYDATHFGGLTGEWQLRNLRQFYRALREDDSDSDRLRFARSYLAGLGLTPALQLQLAAYLVALLEVPALNGAPGALCAEHWRRMRPFVGAGYLGATRAR